MKKHNAISYENMALWFERIINYFIVALNLNENVIISKHCLNKIVELVKNEKERNSFNDFHIGNMTWDKELSLYCFHTMKVMPIKPE